MDKRIIFLACCLGLSGCVSPAQIRQAEIERLKAENQDLLKRTREKNGQIAAFEKESAAAAEDRKSAQSRIDALTKSNQDFSRALESNKGQLAGKVKELISERDELKSALAESQRGRKKLAAEFAALREQHEPMAQELSEIRARQLAQSSDRQARAAKAREGMGAIADSFLKDIQAEKVSLREDGGAIEVAVSADALFEPQQAKLSSGGLALMDRLGRAFRLGPWRSVRVEAHADNSPIKWELFGRFTSHWDLSSARATTVARYLHEHAGLDPLKITAAGFGEFRPLKGNDTPEGRQANRRVVITLDLP